MTDASLCTQPVRVLTRGRLSSSQLPVLVVKPLQGPGPGPGPGPGRVLVNLLSCRVRMNFALLTSRPERETFIKTV